MAGSKIDRKIRFLPYYPFGYCSHLATTIEGRGNPYAGLILLGNNPDKVIAQCEQFRQRVLYRARDLCNKGYAKDLKRACGTPSAERTFRAITQAGLAACAEFPDYEDSLKSNHFYSQSYASAELRDYMYSYADSEDEFSLSEFDTTLTEGIMDARLTPLTAAIALAGKVKINLDKYSSNQRYNIWRLSHVVAMFFANDHLTYLDRRPYDTGFMIDGISDADTYAAYCEKYGITLPAYTYLALSTWYGHHPDYNRFRQQYPDASIAAQNAWLNTPAFYSALELPYNKSDTAFLFKAGAKGRRQVVNSIHIGLATGRILNYVCYHANAGEFKWLPQREKRTKEILESAVRQMKAQNPLIPYNDKVNYALYFCTSYHQFLALFDHIKATHVKGKKKQIKTFKPYSGLHVIPVNDSGAVLLWNLMEDAPQSVEYQIRNKLLEMDIGFEFCNSEYCYLLRYKGKNVFLGHLMDVSKISRALEDYLDGFDFYVMCYPEQVSWYKKLFPGKVFL